MRLFTLLEQLLQDVRYAVRMIVARPLFSAVAALSLALGIGANVAIYSFIDAILLRALPVSDPESLVALKWRSKAQPAVARSLNGDIVRDPRTGFTADGFPYAACELRRLEDLLVGVRVHCGGPPKPGDRRRRRSVQRAIRVRRVLLGSRDSSRRGPPDLAFRSSSGRSADHGSRLPVRRTPLWRYLARSRSVGTGSRRAFHGGRGRTGGVFRR